MGTLFKDLADRAPDAPEAFGPRYAEARIEQVVPGLLFDRFDFTGASAPAA